MEKEVVLQMTKCIEEWAPKEASIAIASKYQYLYYHAGMHDIQISDGQMVPLNSITERVFRQKGRVEALIDASIFGTAYYGIGYPIEGKNELQGVLTVILPPWYTFKKESTLTFLTGKIGETWSPIPIEDILYIESNQKKTWFYTVDGEYCTIHTLKNIEQRLPDYFLRIHRSYIVNIAYIQQISREISSNLTITLKQRHNCILPVSQTYIPAVRKSLGF